MGGFKYIFNYIYTISPVNVLTTMTLIIGEIIIENFIFMFFLRWQKYEYLKH